MNENACFLKGQDSLTKFFFNGEKSKPFLQKNVAPPTYKCGWECSSLHRLYSTGCPIRKIGKAKYYSSETFCFLIKFWKSKLCGFGYTAF